MKVCSVSEMRDLDRTAIETYGIKDELLMENAGIGLFTVIQQKMEVRNGEFCIFCGLGNNGGDGFVIARKIHSNGGRAKVLILGRRDKFRGSARSNLDILSRLPVEVREITSSESVREDLRHCDAVVDAIFGTGLARPVEGLYREVIELINTCGKTVFSVDIPSGISGDTGQALGTAVRADCTVTFGLPKYGNMLFPGYEHCGELYVTHISFPPILYEDDRLKVEINPIPALPTRKKDGHKGSFGDVLFIAGASGYFGAPYFAALSFLKAGGGYSRLAAPRSITPFIANKGSEIVFVPQEETKAGSLSLENEAALVELAEKMDMVVLGPGLSLAEETRRLAENLARAIPKPLLIDGDGITALCADLDIIKKREHPTILTPHLGEMSRITGMKIPEVDRNKISILRETAGKLGATIVLKGAHSLVGSPDGRVFINTSGNSGMATAGSGDVLTGTIAAMFGLGLPVPEAVRTGVFIHGLSGDLAALEKGEDGITAQDILDHLPMALKTVREGISSPLKKRYAGARII
ncbi:MAG: NAD(P)H-hydrate dehydratase [Deltaproteobacteria bacterium]|nr:NAD(P)H-hydrate dehydratase [Deltaproteobacteria bacterium]MBW2303680.1 NAD(P)H-hydrate dehydratase [Deltaproteobacteria bacterium]